MKVTRVPPVVHDELNVKPEYTKKNYTPIVICTLNFYILQVINEVIKMHRFTSVSIISDHAKRKHETKRIFQYFGTKRIYEMSQSIKTMFAY